MTGNTVFNRPIGTYRGIIWRARQRADEKIRQQKTGLHMKPRWKRPWSKEHIQNWLAAKEENIRLGVTFIRRPRALKGLLAVSREPVSVALTPSQIKAANRERLAAALARAAEKKRLEAAKARKAEIDKSNPQGMRHPLTDGTR
jgi:hypothetical protein